MHERNIYKHKRPNFSELAKKYLSFAKYVRTNTQGGGIIDFKNPEALRELAYTLLKEDFNISIEIPLNHLIPTIPLRLNYVHWIEDLVSTIKESPSIIWGIDIGCGASCIYPLLGTKMNGWNFVATDVDQENIKYAVENVKRNSATETITVLTNNEGGLLEPIFSDHTLKVRNYTFCMCNPPFFGDKLEASGLLSRNGKRPLPKSVNTASESESITEGGEVHFVKCMIGESLHLQEKISWFTSMVGKKESMKVLKKYLREQKVPVVTTTEFFQGKTTRWGIGWSYQNDLNMKLLSPKKPKHKKQRPFLLAIPKSSLEKGSSSSVDEAHGPLLDHLVAKVEKQLQDLEITIMSREAEASNGPRALVMTAKAIKNTWIHNRKRKRMANRDSISSPVNKVIRASTEELDCNASDALTDSSSLASPKPDTVSAKGESIDITEDRADHGINTRDTEILNPTKTREIRDVTTTSVTDDSSDLESHENATAVSPAVEKCHTNTQLDNPLETPILFCVTVAEAGFFQQPDHSQFILQFDAIEGNRESLHQLFLFIKNTLNGVQLHGRKDV